MFDIGGPEFILLVLLGLLIFGPRRLPEIGRQLGGFVAQMRMSMREFQGTVEREIAFEEVRKATRQVTDLGREVSGAVQAEAGQLAHDLSGVGPPPYADPARRERQAAAAASDVTDVAPAAAVPAATTIPAPDADGPAPAADSATDGPVTPPEETR